MNAANNFTVEGKVVGNDWPDDPDEPTDPLFIVGTSKHFTMEEGETIQLELWVDIPDALTCLSMLVSGQIRGLLGSGPGTFGIVSDPVNTASGNFVHVESAFGDQSPLPFTRTYNALDDANGGVVAYPEPGVGPFGDGWVTPTDSWLRPLDDASPPGSVEGLEYRSPDGRIITIPPSTGGWTPPADLFATVETAGSENTLVHRDGQRWVYDATSGLVVRVELPDGQVAQVCRNGDGTPVSLRDITNCAGAPTKELTFTDDDSDTKIDRIEAMSGSRIDLDYDALGLLTSSTFEHAEGDAGEPGKRLYRYGNDPLNDLPDPDMGEVGGLMTAVEREVEPPVAPAEDPTTVVEVRNFYDNLGRVVAQDLEDGSHVSFAYGPLSSGTRSTTVTFCGAWEVPPAAPGECYDDEEIFTYVHDPDGRLIGIEDPFLNSIEKTYDRDQPDSFLSRTDTASGATYDLKGRITQRVYPDPSTGALPARSGGVFPAPGPADGWSLEEWGYCTTDTDPAVDPRPSSRTDRAGGVTTYLYGSTNPANPCVDDFGEQSVPTRVIDPAGGITDFETVGGGTTDTGLVSRTVESVGAADEVETLTEWDEAKRQRLSVSVDSGGGQWSTTVYGYDAAGRQSVARTLIDSTTGRWSETWTLYDGAGRVTDVIGPVDDAPSRTCDGDAGRVVSCAFPTPANLAATDIDGPVVHTEYWLDGSLKSRQERANKTDTGSARVWNYSTRYRTTGGSSPCIPPSGTCQRETVELEPAHDVSEGVSVRTERVTRYNANGDVLWSSIGPEGGGFGAATTVNVHDKMGRLASITTPEGVETTYLYDADGNVTSTSTAGVVMSESRYDRRGRVVETLGPEGVVDEANLNARSCTETIFDRADRVVEIRVGADNLSGDGCVASGSTQLDITRTVYDAAGRVRYTIVDADHDGNVTDVQPGTGTGTQVCGGTPDTADVITETRYHPSGRVAATVTVPENVTSIDGFDWCGTGDAAKRVTTITYDSAGRTTVVTPPSGSTDAPAETTYFNAGWVKRQMTGAAFSEFTYDAAGRVLTTAVPNPDGSGIAAVSTTGYDEFGQMVEQAEPAMPAATFGYYPNGSLEWVRNPLASSMGGDADKAEVGYFYDARGNRITRTAWTKDSTASAYEAVHESWAYDLDDRLAAYTDANQVNETTPMSAVYTYDDSGRQETMTLPSGRASTSSYRPDGLLATQTWTGPGRDQIDLVFGYDANGRRTLASDKTGAGAVYATTWTYDAYGRETQKTPDRGSGADQYFQHTWAMDGTLRQVGQPSGGQIRYSYDKTAKLDTVALYIWSIWAPIAVYDYDAEGRRTDATNLGGTTGTAREWTYPNGAAHPEAYHEVYDDNGTTKTTHTDLDWRPDGRLTSETTSGNTRAYDYDDAGQLLERTDTGPGPDYAYTYNARGMRLSETIDDGTPVTVQSTYDDAARLLSFNDGATTTTATHDEDGRRTDLGATSTSYDARGLPMSGGGYTRAYDATGRLARSGYGYIVSDVVWDDHSPTGVSQQYLSTISSSTPASIVSFYGLERLNVGTVVGGTTTTSWYSYDAHGNVKDTSTIVAPDDYSPYGEPTTTAGIPVTGFNGYGYRGEATINSDVHLRARDYDPTTGTFTTRDPLDGVDGTTTAANSYHYADNDPLNKQDPTGMRPLDSSLTCGGSSRRTTATSSLVDSGGNCGRPLGGPIGRPVGFALGDKSVPSIPMGPHPVCSAISRISDPFDWLTFGPTGKTQSFNGRMARQYNFAWDSRAPLGTVTRTYFNIYGESPYRTSTKKTGPSKIGNSDTDAHSYPGGIKGAHTKFYGIPGTTILIKGEMTFVPRAVDFHEGFAFLPDAWLAALTLDHACTLEG